MTDNELQAGVETIRYGFEHSGTRVTIGTWRGMDAEDVLCAIFRNTDILSSEAGVLITLVDRRHHDKRSPYRWIIEPLVWNSDDECVEGIQEHRWRNAATIADALQGILRFLSTKHAAPGYGFLPIGAPLVIMPENFEWVPAEAVGLSLKKMSENLKVTQVL